MDSQKTLTLIEKIKSVAIGFIGAGIFTQGTLYFQAQSEYNIPRILYPIFKITGNIGLAVSMIILGLALLYYGFTKWKKNNGSVNTFMLIGGFAILLFFAVLYFTNKQKHTAPTTEDIEKSENKRQEKIDEIAKMERPNFDNVEIEKYFNDFDEMHTKYIENVKSEDEVKIAKSGDDFLVWVQQATVKMSKLTNDEKQQFGLYLGKLSMQWQQTHMK